MVFCRAATISEPELKHAMRFPSIINALHHSITLQLRHHLGIETLEKQYGALSWLAPLDTLSKDLCQSPRSSLRCLLIRYSYENFGFTDKHIPNDLEKRSFPLSKLGDYRCNCSKRYNTTAGGTCKVQCSDECQQPYDRQFHNYTYARNMKIMWEALRDFVKGYLTQSSGLNSNKAVLNDEAIQNWWAEIVSKDAARLTSFPTSKPSTL